MFSAERIEIENLSYQQLDTGAAKRHNERLLRTRSLEADRTILDATLPSVASPLVVFQVGNVIDSDEPAAEEVAPEGGGPQGNNGHGNGDQDAPVGSGGNTNAENAVIAAPMAMPLLQPIDAFSLMAISSDPSESIAVVSQLLV